MYSSKIAGSRFEPIMKFDEQSFIKYKKDSEAWFEKNFANNDQYQKLKLLKEELKKLQNKKEY